MFEQRLMSVADVGAETDEHESQDGDLAVVAFQQCEFQGRGKRIVRETTGRRKSVRKCSKCMLAYYCNETCQRADWHRHRAVCSKRPSRALQVREVMKRICAEVVNNPGLLTGMRAAGGLGQHDTGWVHFRIEKNSLRKLTSTVNKVLEALTPMGPPCPVKTSGSRAAGSADTAPAGNDAFQTTQRDLSPFGAHVPRRIGARRVRPGPMGTHGTQDPPDMEEQGRTRGERLRQSGWSVGRPRDAVLRGA